jgi:hypothetical protein
MPRTVASDSHEIRVCKPQGTIARTICRNVEKCLDCCIVIEEWSSFETGVICKLRATLIECDRIICSTRQDGTRLVQELCGPSGLGQWDPDGFDDLLLFWQLCMVPFV